MFRSLHVLVVKDSFINLFKGTSILFSTKHIQFLITNLKCKLK